METLSLHEAAPGHHFQIALQQELTGLPAFRRFGGDTRLRRGLGAVRRTLGKELGLYTDPYAVRPARRRAVARHPPGRRHRPPLQGLDPRAGDHYMHENCSLPTATSPRSSATSSSRPGARLQDRAARIRELRTRPQRLGSFDVRDFHTEVLRDGALPLAVLEAKIDRWIEKRQPRAGAERDQRRTA